MKTSRAISRRSWVFLADRVLGDLYLEGDLVPLPFDLKSLFFVHRRGHFTFPLSSPKAT